MTRTGPWIESPVGWQRRWAAGDLAASVAQKANDRGEWGWRVYNPDGDDKWIRDGFTSSLETTEGALSVKHGVVVVATGAVEHKPQSYGYGQSDKVLTQLELSERLARGDLALPEKGTVVMIQCVEQRDENRPYCSRVCCTTCRATLSWVRRLA